jgi:hypothetical protein
MNAHTPPAEFAIGIDPRAAWLARAAALDVLFQAGEISLDVAIDELIDAFLAIVGSAPNPCAICGDPPCRHDGAWCAACREAEARRRRERAKPRPKPPTPQTTIEAIMHDVRTRGIAALKDPDNLKRLHQCDARARAEIDSRIAALVEAGRIAG